MSPRPEEVELASLADIVLLATAIADITFILYLLMSLSRQWEAAILAGALGTVGALICYHGSYCAISWEQRGYCALYHGSRGYSKRLLCYIAVAVFYSGSRGYI